MTTKYYHDKGFIKKNKRVYIKNKNAGVKNYVSIK